MATVHLFLTGKGGVGKSFSASLLYQYLLKKPPKVVAFDTDPVNSTFAGYAEFDINRVQIMDGDDIDQGAFDTLTDEICGLESDTQVIIDNGASCFVSLCSYLKSNHALDVLQDEGHAILIHSIVTGGGALSETLSELKGLNCHFPDVPIIVWLNPYFGEILIDGQQFQDFKTYQTVSADIKSIIEIPHIKQALFSRDLEGLLARKWSFEAGINSSLPIMTRQRLKTMWRNIEQAIDKACLV